MGQQGREKKKRGKAAAALFAKAEREKEP